ncbi:Chromosome partitioning protein ParA [Pseudomonas savastanoi pv. retacarpa]|nr:Chromosome partitioning protein ParA [Pseudomonas savastanoi pv. retacarpa]
MSRADDVANLFQRFGASSDGYLEIDNSLDYQESSVSRTPSAALQRATSQPSLEQPCSTLPAQNNSTAPDLIAPDKTRRIAADTLAKLLAEAAQARQAEAQARNNEALAQSMGKGQLSRTPAHVIAVVSAKGGVGKSTLSAALTSLVKVPGGRPRPAKRLAAPSQRQPGCGRPRWCQPERRELAGPVTERVC